MTRMTRLCVAVFMAGCCLASNSGAVRAQAGEPDHRMEQKVTCTVGYSRLHRVITELRSKTGVSIECGESPKDWNVRDIPIFVHVKDMPLGRLLRSIADAAHMQYIRQKSSSDKPPTYRLCRTKEFQRQLDEQVDGRLKAGMDFAKWAWEALEGFGRSSDASLAEVDPVSRMTPESAKALGKVLASMSPQEKDRILSGGQIKLPGTGPQAGSVQDVCRLAAQFENRQRQSGVIAQAIDPQKAYLIINLYQVKSIAYTGFIVYAGGFEEERVGTNSSYSPTWLGDVMSMAGSLEKVKGLKLPPKPPYDPRKLMTDPLPSGDVKPLTSDEDWKASALQGSVKVTQPANPEEWKCSEVLSEVAERCGLNIVCEDYRSHKLPDGSQLKFDFASCVSAADVLHHMGGYKWFIDDASRLLVGYDESWRWRHKSLVEEAVLDRLRKKLNGSGVGVDDFASTVWLSVAQRDAWFRRSRDLAELDAIFSDDGNLWKVYDMLSPDQKRLAKSNEGLSLSLVDVKWLSSFLSDGLERSERGIMRLTAEKEPAEVGPKRKVYADEKALSSAKLWLRQELRETGGPHVVISGRSLSNGSTIIEVKGLQQGKEFSLRSKVDLTFPIRHEAGAEKPAGEISVGSSVRWNK